MADKSITKTELVASIASATGQSQATVSGVLDSLFGTVSDAVAKGSKVSIPGWISFEQVDTAARTGRNPQTGAEIQIAASTVPGFKAGAKFKAAVNG
jgi:DNA-binding protein HU-beta